MKIAIISDIHENFHNLILALAEIENRGVSEILCLGDLMNTGVARILSIQKVPTFLIWGNNDGEKVEIMNVSHREKSMLKVSLFTYDTVEKGGRSIFLSHYDNLARPMAKSGDFDAVFYGHTHLMSKEKINDTWVVNPGELSAQKTGIASFAIYETVENTVEIIELDNIVTLKTNLVTNYLKANKESLNFRSSKAFGL